MRRYAIPLVLIGWTASLALGITASGFWMVLLVAAVVVQVVAQVESYRHHWRRS